MRGLVNMERRLERLEERVQELEDLRRRDAAGIKAIQISRSKEEADDYDRRLRECPEHLRPKYTLHFRRYPGANSERRYTSSQEFCE